jgi:3-hydroxyacyl-CoA dehydrogenase/enoyl-CoA hydratase/3-hydroxybutyryl-CoA epimerase
MKQKASLFNQLKPRLKTDVFEVFETDEIGIIEMNDPTKSVNSFTRDALEDLNLILKTIFEGKKVPFKGLIFTSTKEDCFAAGADISIFSTLHTKEDGQKASEDLQNIYNYFAKAPIPTLAAIHGVCLGGGLELALACHYRICTSHSSTNLGLPEVQLGILPGGGGTQRLPRLIGILPSLDLILTGKKVDSKKALKLGLVDDVVPPNLLLEESLKYVKAHKVRPLRSAIDLKTPLSGKAIKPIELLLESNPLGKLFLFNKSKDSVISKTKGKYPAPLTILKALQEGLSKPLAQALAIESRYFGELVVTPESRALVHIFDVVTQAKKNPFPKEVQKSAKERILQPLLEGASTVGVLGSGLMGSGIATVLAEKKIRSTLFDAQPASLQKGLEAVEKHFSDKVKRKSIKSFEKTSYVSYVNPTLNVSSLKNCSVVIEAS